MITICEHSFDETLLSRDAKVLDLGCRNFQFANGILQYVDEVICFDPDKDIPYPGNRQIQFICAAVGGTTLSNVKYIKYGNGTGNYIDVNQPAPGGHTVDRVTLYSLPEASRQVGIKSWDLIKMDIEGQEYMILGADDFKPMSVQLSIEFHEHSQKQLHDRWFNKCIENLQKYYDTVKFDRYEAHGCGPNYWDTLFILKKGITL